MRQRISNFIRIGIVSHTPLFPDFLSSMTSGSRTHKSSKDLCIIIDRWDPLSVQNWLHTSIVGCSVLYLFLFINFGVLLPMKVQCYLSSVYNFVDVWLLIFFHYFCAIFLIIFLFCISNKGLGRAGERGNYSDIP